jgi:hypothetical protein
LYSDVAGAADLDFNRLHKSLISLMFKATAEGICDHQESPVPQPFPRRPDYKHDRERDKASSLMGRAGSR